MAVNPITYQDIDAWSRLTGRQPSPWEVSILVGLDDAVRRKQQRQDREHNGEAPVGDGPAAVKALMMTVSGPKKPKKP